MSGGLPVQPLGGGLPVQPVSPANPNNVSAKPPALPVQPVQPVQEGGTVLGSFREATGARLAKSSSGAVGGLTLADLEGFSAEDSVFVEDHVGRLVPLIQDRIKVSDLSDLLGEARLDRGEKYYVARDNIEKEILQYILNDAVLGRLDSRRRSFLIGRVVNEIIGLGPLEPLWADPRVTDIMVNGPDRVRISQLGIAGTRLVKQVRFRDRDHLLALCQSVLQLSNRTVSPSHPIEDGRLPDKSRVAVTHHVIAPDGPLLTIRRHGKSKSVEELVSLGALTEDMVVDLAHWIGGKCTAMVVGGTSSGKDLSVDTPIPTPLGFKRLGDLQVGDQIFDEDGAVCKVQGVFDQERPDCFEVKFDDGSTVIAGREHNWFTNEWGQTVGQVRTTEQIMNTLHTPTGQWNHWVPTLTRPVTFDDTLLNTKTPTFKDVRQFVEQFFDLGNVEVEERFLTAPVSIRKYFVKLLAETSRQHASQKRANTISIPQGHPKLVCSVQTIIHSLGWKTRYDQKTEQIIIDKTSNKRWIVSITKTDNVATRCIEVDSPSRLFLFGNEFIPTHNTTVLNAVSGLIPAGEAIITIEDNLELQLHPDRDVRSMETRPAGASGEGAVTMHDLLRVSLRSNPDRIVVGEVRDGAAYNMLQAMNTGHEGSLATYHANDAKEAVSRLVNLVLESGEGSNEKGIKSLIASSIDLIILVVQYVEDGSRRVHGIYEVPQQLDSEGEVVPVPLWEFVHTSTDEESMKVDGYWEKKNDLSEYTLKRKRLDKRRKPTIDEVYSYSKIYEEEVV